MSLDVFVKGGRPRWEDGSWAHQAVMRLFGDLPGGDRARSDAGILFRVEPGRPGRVLVQSQVEPTARTGLVVRPLQPLLDRLVTGTPVAVHATMNSVVTTRRTTNGVERNTRIAVPANQLATWALSKVPGVVFDGSVSVRSGCGRAKGVPLVTATVEGRAQVVDAQALQEAIRTGVGKGRSFGCGLVSVIPLAQ